MASARVGPIRNLFIKHGVADGLGLILLHKTFDLTDGQVLVDYNGTAMAWDLGEITVSESGDFQKHGGLIEPRAWLLSPTKNKLIPYESYFHHLKSTDSPAYNQTALANLTEDFVNELVEILNRDNLAHILGVYLLKSPLKTEIETSEGCANTSMSIVDDGTSVPPTRSKPSGTTLSNSLMATLRSRNSALNIGAHITAFLETTPIFLGAIYNQLQVLRD